MKARAFWMLRSCHGRGAPDRFVGRSRIRSRSARAPSRYAPDIFSVDRRWPASVGCQDLDSQQGLSLIWGVSDFVSDWDHLSGHSPLKHAFTLGFGG